MNILIDIGHPAHVHYFKNFIKILKGNGHQIFITSREKEITYKLLEAYNFSYKSRGLGKSSLFGKFFYLFIGTYRVWKYAYKNKIDLYISFASPYNALASIFYRRPNIAFDDTEHNIFNHKIYVPRSNSVLTPAEFKKDFGINHLRFDSTMDVAYLHPKYFVPKNVVFKKRIQNQKAKTKIVILRIVSWNASHDINQSGFEIENIYRLIKMLSDFAEVYISSEKALPQDLEKYSIDISPEDIHHYMYNADLFIGESGSMATESAFLGTHSIVLNSAAPSFGVFNRLSNYKIFTIAKDFDDLISNTLQIIKQDNLKEEGKRISEDIIADCINLTDFMVWFVENYPESHMILKENPDYQYNFK